MRAARVEIDAEALLHEFVNVRSCTEIRRRKDSAWRHPKPQGQCAKQFFKHFRVALQPKHGVKRSVGSPRSERSLFQFATRNKQGARQSLHSSVDKAGVAQIRKACTRQRIVPGAAYQVFVIPFVVT